MVWKFLRQKGRGFRGSCKAKRRSDRRFSAYAVAKGARQISFRSGCIVCISGLHRRLCCALYDRGSVLFRAGYFAVYPLLASAHLARASVHFLDRYGLFGGGIVSSSDHQRRQGSEISKARRGRAFLRASFLGCRQLRGRIHGDCGQDGSKQQLLDRTSRI